MRVNQKAQYYQAVGKICLRRGSVNGYPVLNREVVASRVGPGIFLLLITCLTEPVNESLRAGPVFF